MIPYEISLESIQYINDIVGCIPLQLSLFVSKNQCLQQVVQQIQPAVAYLLHILSKSKLYA